MDTPATGELMPIKAKEWANLQRYVRYRDEQHVEQTRALPVTYSKSEDGPVPILIGEGAFDDPQPGVYVWHTRPVHAQHDDGTLMPQWHSSCTQDWLDGLLVTAAS